MDTKTYSLHETYLKMFFTAGYADLIERLCSTYDMSTETLKRWAECCNRYLSAKGAEDYKDLNSWVHYFTNWFRSSMKNHRNTNPDDLNKLTIVHIPDEPEAPKALNLYNDLTAEDLTTMKSMNDYWKEIRTRSNAEHIHRNEAITVFNHFGPKLLWVLSDYLKLKEAHDQQQ